MSVSGVLAAGSPLLPGEEVGYVANPKYGTTVANSGSPLIVATDVKVRQFWVESIDGDQVPVWFRFDGQDPVAGENGSHVLTAGPGSLEFSQSSAQIVSVRFKSTGAVRVSVRTL